MTRTQGAIATKAALSLLGLPGGTVRGPLIDRDRRSRWSSCGADLVDGAREAARACGMTASVAPELPW